MQNRDERNNLKQQYFAEKQKLEEDGIKNEQLDTGIGQEELSNQRPGRNHELARSQ